MATRYEEAEGNTEGDFNLSVNLAGSITVGPGVRLIDNFEETAVRLVPGEVTTGDFSPLRLGRFYTFTATEDNRIDIAVQTTNNTLATIIVADSELNPVAYADDNVLLASITPDSDDYLVIVAPQAGPVAETSESFAVALNAENIDTTNIDTSTSGSGADIRPTSIAYGTTQQGSITDEQNERRYVFRGQEGDIVEISMTSVGTTLLDTYLTLLGPNGEVIGENDDINPGINRNSFLSATLPTDGQYVIVAARYEGDTAPTTTGDYELSITYQDPSVAGVDQEPEAISYGQSLTDTINDETYLHFFYFDGQQGDQVVISVDTTEGNLDGVMYLYTFTSNNEPLQLAANDDSPLGNTFDPYIEYTLPRTARYLIAVTRYVQNTPEDELTSGTFTITLNKVN